MRTLVTITVLAVLAAGCMGKDAPGADAEPPTASTPTSTTSPTTAPPSNETPQVPGPIETFVAYFTADRGLSPVEPAAGFVTDASGIASPSSANGFRLQAWTSPDANDASYQITAAAIDLFYSSDTPQQSLGNALGGDVFAFIGEPDRNEAILMLDGPDQLAPGTVAHASGEFELPLGGLVLPAGSPFSALIGIAYSQNEANPIKVHVGGAEASVITLSYRTLPSPPTKTTVAREETGEFQPGGTPIEFPVAVNASTYMIRAALEGAGSAPVDLDLALLAPSGEVASSSLSPHAIETIRAMRPNFDAGGDGEYVLRVTLSNGQLAGPAGATFTLRIETVELA